MLNFVPLGRGTHSTDGMAIASATVKELANVHCRTMFSTHYHSLSGTFADDPRISFQHMEYVDASLDKEIVFLYKIKDGWCGRSHGFNIATSAGIPQDLIREAMDAAKAKKSLA